MPLNRRQPTHIPNGVGGLLQFFRIRHIRLFRDPRLRERRRTNRATLVDEHLFDWDTAWSIAERTFGYTNHTLLSEALERWPLGLITRVLPRHVEIIYGINQRFLNKVRLRFPNDEDKVRRLSLIISLERRSPV